VLDFRQKFNTDKFLREDWTKETGEELAIDIQEEGGRPY
jgi:hypothetical protein